MPWTDLSDPCKPPSLPGLSKGSFPGTSLTVHSVHTYCVCGSWKHKHTRLFGFHPHCSTLLIHQANIKAAHQKLFSLLSSLFLRDLAEGERKKAGKILVYLKTSILLMALGGDLGHSKFGETILLPVTHFFLVCWKGFAVLWPWKNVLKLNI